MSLDGDLIIASGVPEENLKDYLQKLNVIQNNFEIYCNDKDSDSDLKKARLLHDFFFEIKPHRFKDTLTKFYWESYDEFSLFSNVVNSQISIDKNQTVGNCLGLISLYNVFLDRMNVDHNVLECVFFDNNWVHYMSGIDMGDDLILVETCSENGFDISPKDSLYGNTFFLLRNSNVLVHENYRLRSQDALIKNNFEEALRLNMEAEKVGTLNWSRLLQYRHFKEIQVPGYENIVEFVL